jgi:hypothetical protein
VLKFTEVKPRSEEEEEEKKKQGGGKAKKMKDRKGRFRTSSRFYSTLAAVCMTSVCILWFQSLWVRVFLYPASTKLGWARCAVLLDVCAASGTHRGQAPPVSH